jgi:hypothetical protein
MPQRRRRMADRAAAQTTRKGKTMILDTILIPILLTAVQLGAGFADSYTSEQCFREGERTGLQVYETNPIYSRPFGAKPSMTAFIASDLITVAATYGIGWLIRKTPAHDWYWIPQAGMIGMSVYQSRWNYNLFNKLREVR